MPVCVIGVSGYRSSAICLVGVGYGACLESAAGRNRMSQCVSVEPGLQISGSKCRFPGQQGLTGLWYPDRYCLGKENIQACDLRLLFGRLCCLKEGLAGIP